MDWDGGVNVSRGEGFTLDDGLDGLVDVVVDVLVGLNTAGNLLPNDGGNSLGVVVGVSLFLQLGSVLGDHVVLGLSDNFRQDVEFMLGVQNLLVGDGLNSVLVVVNVSFTVNGLDGLDLFTLLDVFLDDFRGGFRADLGAVQEEVRVVLVFPDLLTYESAWLDRVRNSFAWLMTLDIVKVVFW